MQREGVVISLSIGYRKPLGNPQGRVTTTEASARDPAGRKVQATGKVPKMSVLSTIGPLEAYARVLVLLDQRPYQMATRRRIGVSLATTEAARRALMYLKKPITFPHCPTPPLLESVTILVCLIRVTSGHERKGFGRSIVRGTGRELKRDAAVLLAPTDEHGVDAYALRGAFVPVDA
ncbi:hypothetical protein FIBSPDRAFT_925867 [Athelia psychrophila]|uniref:Uncharacterized protein n=1 Tax=Athelia psychrophila TaxID=1759441 RepID=A0A166TYV9_9AGAM|nr:hypothetical protein FIBSPDRAFT_925867 [Fibularhizoctonia sp. CBS 109695]